MQTFELGTHRAQVALAALQCVSAPAGAGVHAWSTTFLQYRRSKQFF